LTTLFFATDIHGSSVCWNKFINAGKYYGAQVIILGGDMTGKALVPIVHQGNNTYRAVLHENVKVLHGQDEVQELVKLIKSRGYYPYLTDPDELTDFKGHPERLNQVFSQQVLNTAQEWLEFADKKLAGSGILCYVAPGNDDMFELDNLIQQSKSVQLAEGKVMPIDDHYVIVSSGWTNPTPWRTFREESEEKLRLRFENMIRQVKDLRRSIFNLHAPPYASQLDDAPEMTDDMRPKYAGNSLVPVGSKTVREVIEKYQPMLGLFGHIHESKGANRIKKTLCINPGSMYEQGCLCGAIINLERDKVKTFVLTTG
jgi:Icc-related predicted phosphoesterase